MQDKAGYLERMLPGMEDKLFFLGKIAEPAYFVDFGCADGSLMACIRASWPHAKFIGVERREEFAELARIKNPQNTVVLSSLEEAAKECEPEKTVILFSSVLHEVLTDYRDKSGSAKSAEDASISFMLKVARYNFGTVVIRDMLHTPDAYSPSYAVAAVVNTAVKQEQAGDKFLRVALDSFVKKWGEISSYRNLIHFLLKYKYKTNWETELQENYMSLDPTGVQMGLWNYELEYHEEYVLPHVYDVVMEDFGLDIQVPTHVKLIFRRSCAQDED